MCYNASTQIQSKRLTYVHPTDFFLEQRSYNTKSLLLLRHVNQNIFVKMLSSRDHIENWTGLRQVIKRKQTNGQIEHAMNVQRGWRRTKWQTHPSTCLPALGVAIWGSRGYWYLRERRRVGMTGRGARQARVSLCDVVSSVRRASMPRNLYHMKQ